MIFENMNIVTTNVNSTLAQALKASLYGDDSEMEQTEAVPLDSFKGTITQHSLLTSTYIDHCWRLHLRLVLFFPRSVHSQLYNKVTYSFIYVAIKMH